MVLICAHTVFTERPLEGGGNKGDPKKKRVQSCQLTKLAISINSMVSIKPHFIFTYGTQPIEIVVLSEYFPLNGKKKCEHMQIYGYIEKEAEICLSHVHL